MKKKNFYIILLAAVYFVSYLTRTGLATIISEVVSSTGYSKSALSVCLTGSFITYATGQLVSGFLGDRIPPKRLIQFGLITTSLMNILLPLCPNLTAMVAIWSVNGFAQAFMWPPIVKIMLALFSDKEYKKASVAVSLGCTLGPIVLYLLCPLIIFLSEWKTVFYISSACGIAMLFVWSVFGPDIAAKGIEKNFEKETSDIENTGKSEKICGFPLILLPIMLAIIAQGALKDGVTTWVPSYLDETYNMGNGLAILVSVVLPLFSTASFTVSVWVYSKLIKNPMYCSGTFFLIGTLSAVILSLVKGKSTPVDIVLMALLVASMHGVNMILISMLPTYFKNTKNVSFISGVLNCCTYIGSSISTYGMALISEKAGWGATLASWCLLAAFGTAICFVCAVPWRKIDKS